MDTIRKRCVVVKELASDNLFRRHELRLMQAQNHPKRNDGPEVAQVHSRISREAVQETGMVLQYLQTAMIRTNEVDIEFSVSTEAVQAVISLDWAPYLPLKVNMPQQKVAAPSCCCGAGCGKK